MSKSVRLSILANCDVKGVENFCMLTLLWWWMQTRRTSSEDKECEDENCQNQKQRSSVLPCEQNPDRVKCAQHTILLSTFWNWAHHPTFKAACQWLFENSRRNFAQAVRARFRRADILSLLPTLTLAPIFDTPDLPPRFV